MDEDPVQIGECRVSPRDLLFQKIPQTASPKRQIELYSSGELASRLMLVCDVDGTKDGKELQLKLWSESPDGKAACDWIKGANDVSWLTSVPASIFALMLLRDQVKQTGVFPPEVFDRGEIEIFCNGIRDWGIRVIKQTRAAVV